MHHDPHWPRATSWLGSPGLSGPELAVLGVPLNQSITPGRCDQAPGAVREALAYLSTYDVDHGVDLLDHGCVDLGDLPGASLDSETAIGQIRLKLTGISTSVQAIALIGGDNGVTRPGVHALGVPLDRVGLITLDAHYDLRHLDGGHHNGNPVRGLIRDGLPGRNIVQIGIQSFANSRDYAHFAREQGIEVISSSRVWSRGPDTVISDALRWLAPRVELLYIDLDIDVLDRAACPGAPGARPGGILPWQLQRIAYLLGKEPKVRMIDIVEFDPEKDINRTTALAAASCLLHFATGVACRP